jgi:hypothetical protein
MPIDVDMRGKYVLRSKKLKLAVIGIRSVIPQAYLDIKDLYTEIPYPLKLKESRICS